MRNLKTITKQAGLSLLEVLLALVIVSLVLVMATRYYQNAHMQSQTNAGVQTINALASAADQFAQGNSAGGYTDMTDAGLVPYLPLPSTATDLNALSPWGGKVDVTNDGTTPGQIVISLDSTPTDICSALEAKLQNAGVQDSAKCDGNTFTISFE